MKKLLIILSFCALSLAAKSQVVDTSVTFMTSVKIVPFKAKFTDTANVNHLGIRIVNDNLKNSCSLSFILFDQWGIVRFSGEATIQGDDYANWNGNNLFPFIFVGKLYNLTFVNN